MLFVEYDVDQEGMIEIVALINAIEEDDLDRDGAQWLAWRSSHEDGGFGCVAVPMELLEKMENTEDANELRSLVEALVVEDHTAKLAAIERSEIKR
jgi:hypothetical protein